MKLLTSAVFIAFVASASAVAQPSGTVSGTSPSTQQPVASTEPQPAAGTAKAQRRAANDQAENRITAQLNQQQLAKVMSAANPNPAQSVPQTATAPSDCSPGVANCTSGATGQ